MSQLNKIITKLQKRPTPRGFTWDDLLKVLTHFGFEPIPRGKTGGSRRKFINADKVIISLHEPHPRNELKKYQIDQIIEILKNEALL